MTLSRLRRLLAALVASTVTFSAHAINITLQFDGSLNATEQAYFTAAETFWEGALTGYQPGITLTNVVIVARKVDIDGSSNVLGRAGPESSLFQGGFWVAATGLMEFDTADLPNMISNGSFTTVVLHEMAHVLGFGTQWNVSGGPQLYTNGSGQFTGANAVAAFRTEFNQPGASFVPVELGGGVGTADAHWNENSGTSPVGLVDGQGRDMQFELMTGWINTPAFVSQTTLASFVDIGYSITAVPEPAALLLFVAGLPLLRRAASRRAAH